MVKYKQTRSVCRKKGLCVGTYMVCVQTATKWVYKYLTKEDTLTIRPSGHFCKVPTIPIQPTTPVTGSIHRQGLTLLDGRRAQILTVFRSCMRGKHNEDQREKSVYE